MEGESPICAIRVDGIMETILIIEDDPGVQKILTRLFQSNGYSVEVCGDGRSAINAFRKGVPTAVILDLVLPVLSGKDVCREIRRESAHPAIVVVSGLTDEFDKILLLELGADDYVTKPFSPTELLARVKAAIRRARECANPTDQIRFGEASVDFIKMRASVSGSPVCLTISEFRMLKLLVQIWVMSFVDPRYSPKFLAMKPVARVASWRTLSLSFDKSWRGVRPIRFT